jgi:hypothetical protein
MSSSNMQNLGSTSLLFDVVTNCYGLDRNCVQQLRAQGWGPSEVAVAANLSARSGRPFMEVANMYQSNKNWTTVASQIGVSEVNTYSTTIGCRVATGPVSAAACGAAGPTTCAPATTACVPCGNPRALTIDEYNRLRMYGFSDREANTAGMIHAYSGAPVNDIIRYRQVGLTWAEIAERYNVPFNYVENTRNATTYEWLPPTR